MGGDHLSYEGNVNPRKLADRAKARHSLFKRLAASVALGAPEMKHFSRSAFLLSRRAPKLHWICSQDLHQLACKLVR